MGRNATPLHPSLSEAPSHLPPHPRAPFLPWSWVPAERAGLGCWQPLPQARDLAAAPCAGAGFIS